ncbi:hypothetical protein [Streptomyces californicus]|uniref:hypothetical protein n=1 Tax=Streptomyces californicus TaxID=67351 RepID=UPI00067D8A64|nr:hypothetical protein [Streptomyces californicus]QRV59597.1 hypothetical protein I6J40_35790 [Streptomyces californicus]
MKKLLPTPEALVLLTLLHALLDLVARVVPDGDPLAALDHLLDAAPGGARLVQLLRRSSRRHSRQVVEPGMNTQR